MKLYTFILYIPSGRKGWETRPSETMEVWAPDKAAAENTLGVYLSIRCKLPARMEIVSVEEQNG
jgi:hypothetical protein